jgi:hypothetical protein
MLDFFKKIKIIHYIILLFKCSVYDRFNEDNLLQTVSQFTFTNQYINCVSKILKLLPTRELAHSKNGKI